jgi:hydroxypyruvate isomerase
MPRFSANLSFLFQEHAFLDRFEAAARAGFKAVEYISPYDHPAQEIATRLKDNDLTQALFNLPLGNFDEGERGLAGLPGREEEFRRSVEKAARYAKALSCPKVNCLAGIPVLGTSRELALGILIANLRHAAEQLSREGILLLLEPINRFDMPGYLVNRSNEGIAVLDAVNHPNLKLQYDIYHMQRMEGEIAATLKKLMPRIGHIQIADNPGRHEPGTGELNFPYLLAEIDRLGYQGWVGCEYQPKAGTAKGLTWMKDYK